LSVAVDSHTAWVVALAATLAIVNYALRALRWSMYLARLGHQAPFGFAATTYIAGFAFAISPGKLGELARARYYVERGTPFRDLAAIALMERVMDVIAMLALASLALSLVRAQAVALGVLAALVAGVLMLLAFIPRTRVRERAGHGSRISNYFFSALQSVTGALRAARVLLSGPCVLMGLLIGIVAWGCEGIGLYVLAGLSTHANAVLPAAAVGIYAVATVAGAATFIPGGLGGTETVMTALLAATGIPAPDALAITLISRLTTLWLAVAIGWLAVLFLEVRLRRAPACT
jgi:uncharacterized protein (TIRG00374 family)